jgi:DNA-binding transcriptional LysR family regulator
MWDNIKIFYHVAKLGSFSAAGEERNISTSALSRKIAQLEDQLKTQLFYRYARGVKLTEAGRCLYAFASLTYENYEIVLGSILKETKTVSGTIRFQSTQGLISHWLLQDLICFKKQYPDINLVLYGSDSQPELDIGQFDVAIRSFLENRNDLIQDPIKTYNLALYASEGYLKEFGFPKTIEDLNNHRLLSFHGNHDFPFGDPDWHLSLGLNQGEFRNAYFSSNSSLNLFEAAKAHLGIVTLPKGYPPLKHFPLLEILPGVGPSYVSYCSYPKHLEDIKKIKVFVDFLKDCHGRFE